MKPIRLRSNSFYYRLNDHEKACYNNGLPVRFMGRDLRDLHFLPYAVGNESKHVVTAVKQEQELIKFVNDLNTSAGNSGIMAFHSAPTDEAAFFAAASIFETAIDRGFSCACLSTTQLMNRDNVSMHDVYLIYGVNDLPNPQAIWSIRDFLRERDGSLRILVMTSDKALDLDILIHHQLRIHIDFLFCLEDESMMIKTDYRKGRS